ncbi:MAG: UbiA family prenyltransferase, partial [Pseudomonadota bacterium]
MREVLVIDLDSTLLRSDMLFESFWSAFGQDWRSPFRSALALMRGKAALKRYLADAARVDVTTLPYDPEVISYIEVWRKKDGRTALVTASDDSIAQQIGTHLGLFDNVHGSDGTDNLKGARKAEFLIEKYGDGQFAYMGDSEADLAVWEHAKRAITVNMSAALRKQAEQTSDEVEHLTTHTPTLGAYLKAIRPHQWMKNILVFLPMLAAHQIDGISLLFSLLAFVSFSLVASSVYVLNDLLDLNADRAHPRKRMRPFAAGSIPISSGTWMAGSLLGGGTVIALIVGPVFFFVMAGYYALTT